SNAILGKIREKDTGKLILFTYLAGFLETFSMMRNSESLFIEGFARVIVREAWGTKIVKDIPTLSDEFHEGWLQIRGLVDVPESETEVAITAKTPLIRTMLVNLLGTEFFEAGKEAEFFKWAVDHRFYNPEEALLTVQSLNNP